MGEVERQELRRLSRPKPRGARAVRDQRGETGTGNGHMNMEKKIKQILLVKKLCDVEAKRKVLWKEGTLRAVAGTSVMRRGS